MQRDLAVSTRVLVLVLVLVLALAAACGGSRRSSEMTFSRGIRAACADYVVQAKTADARMKKSPQTNIGVLLRPEVVFFVALRKLTPPSKSGVSAETWRRVLDVQTRDFRALDAFYKRENPILYLSFKGTNPKPKLPPGTGATAEILAQAFNSPTARRYFRLLGEISRKIDKDSHYAEKIMRETGVLKACRLQFASLKASSPNTAGTKTTVR